jgi:hypothetical protein
MFAVRHHPFFRRITALQPLFPNKSGFAPQSSFRLKKAKSTHEAQQLD